MGIRDKFANSLEDDRNEILQLVRMYPLEMTYPSKREAFLQGVGRFRVVIDCEDAFHELIRQLRADVVTPGEALNPTLIHGLQ